jgi:hypothetical protein
MCQYAFSNVMDMTYGSGHGSQLSIGVIRRSDFDDIGSDQVDALKTTDDSAELTSSPSACLRGTSSRCN